MLPPSPIDRSNPSSETAEKKKSLFKSGKAVLKSETPGPVLVPSG